MRILLNECVPWPLHMLLRDHACASVREKGWSGIKNGDLLQLAENQFDLSITADQNIRYQQNLKGRDIAILELSTNDIRRLQAAHDLVSETIDGLAAKEFRHLDIP